MKSKVFSPHPFPILSNRLVPLNISNVAGNGFQGQWLEEENEQGHGRGSVRLGWAISPACGTLHHATVCSTDISRAASPLCTTAIEMEWLQALGTTNYLGKEKSNGQTNKGEELSLLSSGMRLRTASRSQEGVEQHTPKGVITCKRGWDSVLLLTEILNTEETERLLIQSALPQKSYHFHCPIVVQESDNLHSITLGIQILS